ncbi:hypothetical protein Golob_024182, partial [Gossypium lobatum]|nr:hypothetical protein [Gossypium lobatum]
CTPEDVATVSVIAAKDLLGSNHCYLDVRTPEEFSKSHIHHAFNVPYMFITQ